VSTSGLSALLLLEALLLITLMVDGKSLLPGIVSYCQEMAARDKAAWMNVRIVLHLVIEIRSLPLYYYVSDGNGALVGCLGESCADFCELYEGFETSTSTGVGRDPFWCAR
jgi:hypothetical protein